MNNSKDVYGQVVLVTNCGGEAREERKKVANIATRYTCSCKTERTPRLRIVEHIAGMVEINNTKRSGSGSVKMVDIV